MSKATTTLSTAPMPLPSTSRRRLLGGSGLAAGLAAVGLPAAAATPTDPVVGLYAQWLALQAAKTAARAKHSALRTAFVAQHGEVIDDGGAALDWQADTRKDELNRLCDEVDGLGDRADDIVNAMLDTPATTVEGVRCKLLVVLDNWNFLGHSRPIPSVNDGEMTVTALRDAVRVLGGSAQA